MFILFASANLWRGIPVFFNLLFGGVVLFVDGISLLEDGFLFLFVTLAFVGRGDWGLCVFRGSCIVFSKNEVMVV